jgi:hypothetical protein
MRDPAAGVSGLFPGLEAQISLRTGDCDPDGYRNPGLCFGLSRQSIPVSGCDRQPKFSTQIAVVEV